MEATANLAESGMMLEGTFGGAHVLFRAARIDEGLSRITEMRVEMLSTEEALDAPAMLGTRMRLTMNTDTGRRRFQGLVTAVDFMGTAEGYDLYGVEVRPWLWFLTRRKDNRIFQGQSTTDIFDIVCGDLGFTGFRMRLSGQVPVRDYCVQYAETDFAFLSRLLEEEGICYYFDHSGDEEELILADGMGGHDPVAGGSLPYTPRSRRTTLELGHVFEWFPRSQVVSGSVSLIDYDMLKPTADLTAMSAIPRGRHAHNGYERYEIDAFYSDAGRGEDLARTRMEAEAHAARRHIGVANAPDLGAGRSFTLTGAPRGGGDGDYLVIVATHHLRVGQDDRIEGALERLAAERRLVFPDDAGRYVCRFEAAPSDDPFRPPRVTPWPDLGGLHTAMVTGPRGEEIYTDQYGRIKVQFHWDRQGRRDEQTTCWIRTVVPWSGRGWGMFGVPRIGQEVVIQFERGNPDRPICTGMLYNDVTRHAFPFPDNQTMSGLRTNSTKGGGGAHELVFEDKKGDEYIRMISEKDYFRIIKNNATVSIGEEKKDPGDLTQTIHRHKTETIKTGNHVFAVQSGNQKITVARDHSTKIGGTSTTRIKGDTSYTVEMGDYAETIEMGSFSQKISMGDRSSEISMGNDSTKVSLGNITMDATAGHVTLTALQHITLKVGASSIKVSPTGVDIKGPMIKINGTGMVSVKAPFTEIKGTGLLVLKGSLTMIN